MRTVDRIFNEIMANSKAETYTYYDYLESDGRGQYIDTGIKGYNDTSMIFHYLSCDGETGIFGARDGNNGGATTANELLAYFQANHMYYGKGNGWEGAITAIYPRDRQYTLDVAWQGGNSTKFTLTNIDTQEVSEVTINRSLAETTMSLLLFAVNDSTSGGVIKNTNRLKNGRVERYDNNVLTQDFRPAVRNSDGVAGMHDVVNDVFLPSANGVNFLYGNF